MIWLKKLKNGQKTKFNQNFSHRGWVVPKKLVE